jgi:hypothetical protein
MTLSEAARVLRSKNAGPLALTIDILFENRERYALAAGSPALARDSLARLYAVPEGDVEVLQVPMALAIKITLPRPIVAGSPGDRDVYGAQQHRRLLDVTL